jgi:teichoic acid transport system ATP-binding protein
MKSRLGFSIAAMIKPDVFIIDEILSVGDISFYEKATAKIQELMTDAKAVLVVTHNMSFVERVCTRAIWLEKGSLMFDGDPEQAIALYRSSIEQTKKI